MRTTPTGGGSIPRRALVGFAPAGSRTPRRARTRFAAAWLVASVALICLAVAVAIHGTATAAAQPPTANVPLDGAAAPRQKTCDASATHLASPGVVPVGGRVTITLSLTADCSSVHVPAHVALLFDNSAAMGGVRMNYMKQAVEAFVSQMDFTVARVGLVRYNQIGEVLAPVGADPGPIIDATQQFYPRPGSNITMGMRAARQALEAGRELAAVPDPEEVIIVMVGDENDNGPEEALAEAQLAKDAGMTILTIAAGINADPVMLEAMATSPALFRSEGTGSRWPSLYTDLAGELGTVSAAGAAITTTLPASFAYQFGSGFPVPRVRGQDLAWQFGVFPESGVTVQFQVQANETGLHPVSTGASAELIMDRGLPQRIAFPVPEVEVVGDASPTPLARTPTPTPSPTARFRSIFLPLASSGECLSASPPSEIIVVVDTSRSMMTAAHTGVRLDSAVEAAATVLDGLRFPRDSGALVAASDEAVLLKSPTVNRGALISALGSVYVQIGDDSNLEKGLALAAALPPDPARRRVIVAITDGVTDATLVRRAVVEARASGALVEVVGFGPGISQTGVGDVAGAGGHWAPDASVLEDATERARRAVRCGT